MATYDLNNITVGGRLARKPEIRYTPSQKPVTNITLANNQGEYNGQDVVHWIQVVVWGKQAERMCEYLDKGAYVIVEGQLQTREFEDENNNKRTVTEVRARNVYWMDNGNKGSNNSGQSSYGNNQNQGQQNNYPPQNPSSNTSEPSYDEGGVSLDISDDDIPF